MIRYLLDTNVISELVRPLPNEGVAAHYRTHEHEGALASVVWHELRYGVERLASGRRRDELAVYMDEVIRRSLPILPYDEAAAQWHSRERARLESIGQTPSFSDSMIAATAAAHHLILVTRNTTDFEGFDGLHLENWFAP